MYVFSTGMQELKRNIERLIALYETQKQASDELSASVASLRAENEAYRQQITELNRQIDNLKLKSALTGSGDSEESRRRLSALIREIDKCIRLLEN